MIEPAVEIGEKIALLEQMIRENRPARNLPADNPDHRRLTVLKAIAADIRADLQETRKKVLEALTFQIVAARRQKGQIGYMEIGMQQAVAEATLAHWPAIRRTLLRYEWMEAEKELYEMMAHDLAPEAVITRITERFPGIAAIWRHGEEEYARFKQGEADAAAANR